MGMHSISKEGVVKAGFLIVTKELKQVLRLLKSSFKNTNKRQMPYCEVTIKTGKIEIAVAGSKSAVNCQAWGPARFVIGFEHFILLVNDRPRIKTKVVVGDDFMTINDSVTVTVQTWYFKKDTILRTIDVPVNFTIIDILKLGERYTKEEIEFNKLKGKYEKAHNDLYVRIEKIKRLMKEYQLKEKDVEEAIYKMVIQG